MVLEMEMVQLQLGKLVHQKMQRQIPVLRPRHPTQYPIPLMLVVLEMNLGLDWELVPLYLYPLLTD